MIVVVVTLFIGASVIPSISGNNLNNEYEIIITDDFSYPQQDDYDYGVDGSEIFVTFTDEDTINITTKVHNYGLCIAAAGHGWYSPTGRSCWCEWDFTYPETETVDISYRCCDDVTVDWRVELDGDHLASPAVPGVSSGKHWKIVTIRDVGVTAGSHTLFLGTYQMDYSPDIKLDWVQIGEKRIEAENYDHMGGNDPNSDLRGVVIHPMGANPPTNKNLITQIWKGEPQTDGELIKEDFVGKTTTIIDKWHNYPGNTCTAHYIENGDIDQISAEYELNYKESFDDEISVIVDSDNVLDEKDESNNIANKKYKIQNAFLFGSINNKVTDSDNVEFKAGLIIYFSFNPIEIMVLNSDEHIIVRKDSGLFVGEKIIFGNFMSILQL